MDNSEFQLYEKRLDNCNKMLAQFKEGDWGFDFWSKTFAVLLRSMNNKLHG